VGVAGSNPVVRSRSEAVSWPVGPPVGEFFTEWGVRLDAGCVGGYCKPEASIQVFVDGDRFEGDPATIELVDQEEIAIVIGSPPETIPTSIDFGQP
jgi:hypothetical protein